MIIDLGFGIEKPLIYHALANPGPKLVEQGRKQDFR